MSVRLPLAFLLPCLAAPFAAAQVVSPPAYSGQPGGLFHHTAPLGGYRQSVVQQVHDDLRGVPRTMRGLAFRRALDVASQGAHRIEATILVGRSIGGPLRATFAENYDGAPRVVAARRWFDLPDWTGPRPTYPAAFDAVLTFDAPYVHDGASGLAWEIRVHDHDAASANGRAPNYIIDAFRGVNATHGTGGRWGNGCVLPGQWTPMFTTLMLDAQYPGEWRTRLSGHRGLPNAPGWILLGTSRQTQALPGMCGDLLVGGVLGSVAGMTDATGTLHGGSFTAPFRPELVGAELVAQTVVGDPSRRPPSIAFGNAAAATLVAPPPAPPPVGMVVATFSDTATSGRATPSQALIVELR